MSSDNIIFLITYYLKREHIISLTTSDNTYFSKTKYWLKTNNSSDNIISDSTISSANIIWLSYNTVLSDNMLSLFSFFRETFGEFHLCAQIMHIRIASAVATISFFYLQLVGGLSAVLYSRASIKKWFCCMVFNSHMVNATEVQLRKWCCHLKFVLFMWRSRTPVGVQCAHFPIVLSQQ
jgi:hypothetical protein